MGQENRGQDRESAANISKNLFLPKNCKINFEKVVREPEM
jgi:hypothetical protein